MNEYDVSHDDVLAVLRPSKPTIAPVVDLMARLVAQRQVEEVPEKAVALQERELTSPPQDVDTQRERPADLQRAGVTGDVFATVQRRGYLLEWTQERWKRAEVALMQERLRERRLGVQCAIL